MSLADDYRLLELPHEATEQEAKAAYRRLARLYHPDKNPHKDTTEQFQALQSAYQSVLAAIRQGHLTKDWKTFDFQTAASEKGSSEAKQKAFIREQQQAYETLKRNSARHEKVREEAIRSARHTLNERRVKKLYEEAFRASPVREYFDQQRHTSTVEEQINAFINAHDVTTQIYESTAKPFNASNISPQASMKKPIMRTTLRAFSYLVVFITGMMATHFWPKPPEATTLSIDYIDGLYPQFRQGLHYTLKETPIYSAPNPQESPIRILPALTDVNVFNTSQSNWFGVQIGDSAGWVMAASLGFGGADFALNSGCLGHPGMVPQHGTVIGDVRLGKSRLRVLNSLSSHSLLRFESYDGLAAFSIFLHANEPFAANFIPKGHYRLLLITGSLYHGACQQFLFGQSSQLLQDRLEFGAAELTLSLSQ